jgi:hypothetical protein
VAFQKENEEEEEEEERGEEEEVSITQMVGGVVGLLRVMASNSPLGDNPIPFDRSRK